MGIYELLYDKYDYLIQDGDYLDVQQAGVHKVYRNLDGELCFRPYGEEEWVASYFRSDIMKVEPPTISIFCEDTQ